MNKLVLSVCNAIKIKLANFRILKMCYNMNKMVIEQDNSPIIKKKTYVILSVCNTLNNKLHNLSDFGGILKLITCFFIMIKTKNSTV